MHVYTHIYAIIITTTIIMYVINSDYYYDYHYISCLLLIRNPCHAESRARSLR